MSGLRERQKQRRRERIYRTALALFRERGFDRTTADDIARASHVSRGTFFNYFPYKEAVLLEFGAELLDEAWAEAEARLGAGEDPLSVLRSFWDRLAELSEVELGTELFSRVAYELLNPDPERAAYAYRMLPLAERVKRLLAPLAEAGRLRRDLSLERISAVLADNFLLAALRWAAYGAAANLKEETRKFLTIALEGALAR